MIRKYHSLNIYFRSVVWSLLVLIVISLGLIPLYFIGWGEIPLGILLGGCLGILSYFINGFVENKQDKRKAINLTIFILFARLVLILGIVIGLAFLYFSANVHLFNIFAVTGSYFLGDIAFIIVASRRKED